MKRLGCEVERVQDLGIGGATDTEVFQAAQGRGAVLVTTDKGFGDVRSYPPSSHYGIIVLKVTPNPEQVRSVHRTLETLVETENRYEGTLLPIREYDSKVRFLLAAMHGPQSSRKTIYGRSHGSVSSTRRSIASDGLPRDSGGKFRRAASVIQELSL
jgi:predicted nuclease of predicted toxin-antitoxin system